MWARVKGELRSISYVVSGTTVKVQFYLMEEVKEEEPVDSGRKHEWLPLEKAVGQASDEETRQLLRLAEEERTSKSAEFLAVPRSI